MNDPKIVSPEKTGKNHFKYADEVSYQNSRKYDNLHIE